MAESKEELKSLLMKVEESEKASLKFNIKKKLRSWHLVSSLHGKRRGKGESSDRFHSSQALKSLWMVTAAMKLEDDCFLTGKLTNLDTVLKSKDISLPTKVHIAKAMVIPVVTYSCESWTRKKAEHQRSDAFKLWCWRRLLKVP